MIRKEQVISKPYRTLTSIKREIAATENQRQLLLNEAMSTALQNDSLPNEAISLLQDESTAAAKRSLLGLYIDKKDYTQASHTLNNLAVTNEDELAFADLHQLYIDLGTANKSLWEMDSVQKEKVKEIATMCPAGIATLNAKALMALVFGEQVPECFASNARVLNNVINENKEVIVNYNPLMYDNLSYLGNNIPNPFKQNTHIPYQLPNDVSEGVLQIKDMQGKLLKSIIITNDKASAEITMDELDNGVYTYSLYISNVLVETKRMILMK